MAERIFTQPYYTAVELCTKWHKKLYTWHIQQWSCVNSVGDRCMYVAVLCKWSPLLSSEVKAFGRVEEQATRVATKDVHLFVVEDS